MYSSGVYPCVLFSHILILNFSPKERERERESNIVSFDLERAYDKVPKKLLWLVLDNKGIPLKFIDAIKDMHYGAIFIARMIGGAKTKFSFMIGFKISICI